MKNEHDLFISSISRHVELSDAEFETVLSHAHMRRWKKGQFIIHEGALVRRTHYIRKGAAIAYFIDKEGNEHVIQFAVEGWWISDMHSYVSGEPAVFQVQALEECEVYEFTYDTMQQIFREVPAMQSYFLTITQNGYDSFLQRTVYNMSMRAEERYRIFAEKYPKFESRFAQKLIASYLGMTPEFLSKIKKRIG
jgi:CRP-like cAMP-binding protein